MHTTDYTDVQMYTLVRVHKGALHVQMHTTDYILIYRRTLYQYCTR